MFSGDWKTFKIRFHGTTEDFNFVVTKIRRGGGKLSATVRIIYDGDLREYTITTTKNEIILTSTIEYKITVASEEYAPAPVEEIMRPNTQVMSFRRTPPAYMVAP